MFEESASTDVQCTAQDNYDKIVLNARLKNVDKEKKPRASTSADEVVKAELLQECMTELAGTQQRLVTAMAQMTSHQTTVTNHFHEIWSRQAKQLLHASQPEGRRVKPECPSLHLL